MYLLRLVVRSVVAILITLQLQACCGTKPLLTFSTETPPLILAPATSAGVRDGRGRFREIYCAINNRHGTFLPEARSCEDSLWRLEGEPAPTGKLVNTEKSVNNLKILVIPGIFGECVIDMVSPFSDALAHLTKLGYKSEVIRVSGRSSCAHNARQIRDALVGMNHPVGEKIILIGYSKGTPDILEALVSYPEIHNWISAVVSVSGVVAGSPVADSMPEMYAKLVEVIPAATCPSGDGGAIESLKRSTRLNWLSHNKNNIPASIKFFSITGFENTTGISSILRPSYKKLAHVDPRNDGQVTFLDAIIPDSTLLGYLKADHWAIALPFSRTQPVLATTLVENNAFPREVLLEAIVRFVEETL